MALDENTTFPEFIQTFQIENLNLRGRIVRLNDLLSHIMRIHQYPYAVSKLLAETIVAASLLAKSIKYEGLFTLQTSSSGPITRIVVDVTTEGAVRACVQYDEEKLSKILKVATTEEIETSDIRTFLGSGYLAFTVDQSTNTDRYQGIVQLTGKNIEDAIQAYFKESEQIETAFKIGVGLVAENQWHATGIMLQRLPEKEDLLIGSDVVDNWRRAMIFMSSLTPPEMLAPSVSPNEILYRLFHEDGVRVYEQQKLFHGCRCSGEKLLSFFHQLPKEDLEELMEDGTIKAMCEFCKSEYAFTEKDFSESFSNKGKKQE